MTSESPLQVPVGVRERRVPNVPVEAHDGRNPVTWYGVTALYTDEEKADLRRLPADELWEIHKLKAELDATLVDE